MKRYSFVLSLVLILSSEVFAGCSPVASPTNSGRVPESQALLRQIAQAEKDAPETFKAVAAVKAQVKTLDQSRRGPLAVIRLSAPSKFTDESLPLLAEILRDQTPPDWSETARVGWKVAVLSALAKSGDTRARLPLLQLIEHETDSAVFRAAGAALARILPEIAEDTLVPLTQANGSNQKAAISALGECRTFSATRALAAVVKEEPKVELAVAAAEALGVLASSWAWQTPELAARSDGAEIRSTASGALVESFTKRPGEVRRVSEIALMTVDSPETPRQIDAMRAALPAEEAALRGLGSRWAKARR